METIRLVVGVGGPQRHERHVVRGAQDCRHRERVGHALGTKQLLELRRMSTEVVLVDHARVENDFDAVDGLVDADETKALQLVLVTRPGLVPEEQVPLPGAFDEGH